MKTLTRKPIHQKAYNEVKNKNIVLHSIKIYADKKKRDDIFTVTPALQTALKKAKDLATFKKLLRPAVAACKIDSAAVKKNLANHSRERQVVRNPVAKALGLDRFIIEYGNKEKSVKKNKKMAVKKNHRKAAVKKNKK